MDVIQIPDKIFRGMYNYGEWTVVIITDLSVLTAMVYPKESITDWPEMNTDATAVLESLPDPEVIFKGEWTKEVSDKANEWIRNNQKETPDDIPEDVMERLAEHCMKTCHQVGPKTTKVRERTEMLTIKDVRYKEDATLNDDEDLLGHYKTTIACYENVKKFAEKFLNAPDLDKMSDLSLSIGKFNTAIIELNSMTDNYLEDF